MRAFSFVMALLPLATLGLAAPEMNAQEKSNKMQQINEVLAQLPQNLPEGFYVENADICCPSISGICADGSVGTPCCATGPCNIFCCNCDGQCH